MSFNVRMDTEKDGDNRWDCRKEVVANIIRSQHPLVFGLQVRPACYFILLYHILMFLLLALPQGGDDGHHPQPAPAGLRAAGAAQAAPFAILMVCQIRDVWRGPWFVAVWSRGHTAAAGGPLPVKLLL